MAECHPQTHLGDSRLSLRSQTIRTKMEGWQKAVGAEKWGEKGRLDGGEIKGAELFDSGADEGASLSQQGREENEKNAR